ncbi:MAG TPA: hypothetical protein VGE25_09710 [Sediminibacterium sp.]|nr:hypothetical protein [Bacteroidota bacterium]
MKKYALEIYVPNSTSDVAAHFESDMPFSSIGKGNILNVGFYTGYGAPPHTALRVINIEHIIWQHPGAAEASHKICVFTEEVQDTHEVRMAGYS